MHASTQEVPDASIGHSKENEITRLTQQMVQGDETAFEQFHHLFRFLIVVTHGNEAAARDALQATYLRVVKHIKSFDDEDVFWSWLTVLARSAAKDGGRKMQRYWNLLKRYALFHKDIQKEEDDLTQNQRYETFIDQCLPQLSAMDQKLIEAKYFKGATVLKLSQETKLTPKAVESRLLRARKQLRTLILKALKDEAH